MKKTLALALVAAVSTSLFNVALASDKTELSQTETNALIQQTNSYNPGNVSFDFEQPENMKKSEATLEIVPDSDSSEKVQTANKPRVPFAGGIGYTYVVGAGLYYEGAHSTVPNDLFPYVGVHGYIGKQRPSESSVTWVDNDSDYGIATKEAISVVTGENKQAKGVVGDAIYGKAMHTITTLLGTATAETSDGLIIR